MTTRESKSSSDSLSPEQAPLKELEAILARMEAYAASDDSGYVISGWADEIRELFTVSALGSPHPPSEERLKVLAIEAAKTSHAAIYRNRRDASDIIDGHSADFADCPHADCAMVRR